MRTVGSVIDGNPVPGGRTAARAPGLIDKVGFTGSSVVGAELGALTGRHLQTACLELGGYEEYLGWIQPHHDVRGATGRITADNPRADFIGDPGAGLFYHPVVVDGVRPGDRLFAEETFGPIVGVTTYGTLSEAVNWDYSGRLLKAQMDVAELTGDPDFRLP